MTIKDFKLFCQQLGVMLGLFGIVMSAIVAFGAVLAFAGLLVLELAFHP